MVININKITSSTHSNVIYILLAKLIIGFVLLLGSKNSEPMICSLDGKNTVFYLKMSFTACATG